MIEVTCCPKVSEDDLFYGAGSFQRTPKLLCWECVNIDCNSCGVEKNLMMTTYTVLYECEHVVDVIEWVQAPRADKKKNGQQNSQLKLGTSKLSVSDTLEKLITQLGLCRVHQFHYELCNIIRKVDHSMSDPDIRRVFCTDFGATLDLCAIEKDNYSVDNHCIVCILKAITGAVLIYKRRGR